MVFPILGSGDSSAGYNIQNSCRWSNGTDDPYLSFTPGSGSAGTTFTLSFWVKKCRIGNPANAILMINGAGNDANYIEIIFRGTNDEWQIGGYTKDFARTKHNFRDMSAWSHCVLGVDTTDGTTANRMKFYVNGSLLVTDDLDGGTGNFPSQNDTFAVTKAYAHKIGGIGSGTGYLDGYLADFHLIDGTQYAASDFGEFDGDSAIWKPKLFTGSFGSNGFKLEFKQTGTSADSVSIGADTSGNGNHASVNGLTALDQCTDTPTNNFCTMNPLVPTTDVTFSEGNLKMAFTSSGEGSCLGTMGMSNGKWYFENKAITVGGGTMVGIFGEGVDIDTWPLYLDGIGVISPNGYKSVNGTETAYGDSYTDDDIVSVAVDLTNNKIYWAKNGTWMNSGDPTSGATGTGALSLTADKTWFAGFADGSTSSTGTSIMNFGNPPNAISSGNADANGYGNFEYAVPSGYYALCTKNLAEYG